MPSVGPIVVLGASGAGKVGRWVVATNACWCAVEKETSGTQRHVH